MTQIEISPNSPLYLVSGVTGFIGGRLLRKLAQCSSVRCRILARRPLAGYEVAQGDILEPRVMTNACQGVGTIFHCAGYAHGFSSLSGVDSEMHWRVNFAGTKNIVDAAGRSGVKRFIFLSSVKAMAEPEDSCASEEWLGEPQTAYGQSKLAAEGAVIDAGRRYGMHVVNLRLAMVYGSGGRGNLERMGRLVRKGVFPPLPETGNRRSLVHVDDVVTAMLKVAQDDRANGRTYIVASREAPSGRQLFDTLRTVQGLQPCNWEIPEGVFRFAGHAGDVIERMTKRRMPMDSEVVSRLLDSAFYSPARIEKELGWEAQVGLVDGLREMLRV